MAEGSSHVPARDPSRVSLAPSRRSVSFVGGIHPEADYNYDAEREPLLTRDGQKRTKRKLTALLNSRRYRDSDYRNYEDEEPRSWMAVLGIIACIFAVLFVIVAAGIVVAQNPIPGSGPHHLPRRNPSYLIHAQHGAVASESETCSKVGVEILQEGGNAVDAAIAANLCVGVVNMFSSGIGGGGFMTIKPPGEPAWTIDFRETAPSGSNSTMFLKDPLSSLWGGLSVAVPGEIRGLAAAHERWGKLPWKRLFHAPIRLAQGFTVTKMLERRLKVSSV
jgi:gamma-glutamyltranspeptidase / glutathione hydrolase / leukotriene-C4 hydrolase